MDSESFMELLRTMEGIDDVAVLSDDLGSRVASEDHSVSMVAGGMRMSSPGVDACLSKDRRFVLFCNGSFPRPRQITMEMVDDDGQVIGHDVPSCMMDSYAGRDDVIWIADSFVMYPSRVGPSDACMVMHESRFVHDSMPDGIDAWIFYPCMTSACMLNEALGFVGDRMSTVILGVNGLERRQCLWPM